MTWLSLKERTTDKDVIAACREMSDFDGTSSESFYEVMKEHGLIEKTNVLLRGDIDEWQKRYDDTAVDSDNFDCLNREEAMNYINEARTLLLRASLSL